MRMWWVDSSQPASGPKSVPFCVLNRTETSAVSRWLGGNLTGDPSVETIDRTHGIVGVYGDAYLPTAIMGECSLPPPPPPISLPRSARVDDEEDPQQRNAEAAPSVQQKKGGLSMCFVTIVVNGLPFLRPHAPVFAEAADRAGVDWYAN